MSDAASRLQSIRDWLNKQSLDAFILPVADAYLSEYVPPHAMRLQWLTGFTGSAGTLVITEDAAVLFTDGRYTAQARKECDTRLYQILNSSDTSPSDWLAHGRIGYDPALHSMAQIAAMEKKGLMLAPVSQNPVDQLWRDRPKPAPSKVWRYEDIYAGESAGSKLARMAKYVADNGADALFIAASDNINWLLNIRASDVECTPILQAYAMLQKNGEVEIYIEPAKISPELFGKNFPYKLRSVEEIPQVMATLSGKVLMMDAEATPVAFSHMAKRAGVCLLEKQDPIVLAKAVKNAAEIKHMRRVHVLDGAALVSTFFWLKQAIRRGESVDEMLVGVVLEQNRSKQQGFIGLSFPAIVGAGANGAIVHYRATPASNRLICSGELLLIDSGGQYLGGTTDVTRTLAIGSPTATHVDHYTRVLKGHIALAMAIFPKGTTGSQLDALARQYLWEAGLDYDHGTGHGVGACLSVHEGPQRISKRGGGAALQPGMVLSNEPGVYLEGSHGIRIENLVEVVERIMPNGATMLGFANLTLVPYDMALIDKSKLTSEETAWINHYHAEVLSSLSGFVDDDVREWLKQCCQPI